MSDPLPKWPPAALQFAAEYARDRAQREGETMYLCTVEHGDHFILGCMPIDARFKHSKKCHAECRPCGTILPLEEGW